MITTIICSLWILLISVGTAGGICFWSDYFIYRKSKKVFRRLDQLRVESLAKRLARCEDMLFELVRQSRDLDLTNINQHNVDFNSAIKQILTEEIEQLKILDKKRAAPLRATT